MCPNARKQQAIKMKEMKRCRCMCMCVCSCKCEERQMFQACACGKYMSICKGCFQFSLIGKVRYGIVRGTDTVVVLALNHATLGLRVSSLTTVSASCEKSKSFYLPG